MNMLVQSIAASQPSFSHPSPAYYYSNPTSLNQSLYYFPSSTMTPISTAQMPSHYTATSNIQTSSIASTTNSSISAANTRTASTAPTPFFQDAVILNASPSLSPTLSSSPSISPLPSIFPCLLSPQPLPYNSDLSQCPTALTAYHPISSLPLPSSSSFSSNVMNHSHIGVCVHCSCRLRYALSPSIDSFVCPNCHMSLSLHQIIRAADEEYFYNLLFECLEDFQHPNAALIWLTTAKPTRTGKLMIPKSYRIPKSTGGRGGYAESFLLLGLSLRPGDTQSGHWHSWYVGKTNHIFAQLQTALTRRAKEVVNIREINQKMNENSNQTSTTNYILHPASSKESLLLQGNSFPPLHSPAILLVKSCDQAPTSAEKTFTPIQTDNNQDRKNLSFKRRISDINIVDNVVDKSSLPTSKSIQRRTKECTILPTSNKNIFWGQSKKRSKRGAEVKEADVRVIASPIQQGKNLNSISTSETDVETVQCLNHPLFPADNFHVKDSIMLQHLKLNQFNTISAFKPWKYNNQHNKNSMNTNHQKGIEKDNNILYLLNDSPLYSPISKNNNNISDILESSNCSSLINNISSFSLVKSISSSSVSSEMAAIQLSSFKS